MTKRMSEAEKDEAALMVLALVREIVKEHCPKPRTGLEPTRITLTSTAERIARGRW